MSASSNSCGTCGHTNTGDAMFCSRCGARLPPAGEPQPAASAPAAEAPAPAQPSAPAKKGPRRVAGAAKTMLGVGMDEPAAPPRAEESEPTTAEEAAPAAPPRRVAGSARTMLGMPAPDAEVIAEAVREAKAARAAAESAATDRGLGPAAHAAAPADTTDRGLGPAAHAAAPADATDRGLGPAAADAAAPADTTDRGLGPAAAHAAAPADTTARGLGPSASAARAAEPAGGAADDRPAKALGPTNRTMLGQPAPKVPLDGPAPEPEPEPERRSSVPPASRGRAPVVYPADTGELEALKIGRPKKKSGGAAMAMLAIGLLALVIGGGALIYTLASGSSLRASVVQGDDGEMLEIEVPGAAQGTQVRFHGSEKTLEAGRARFPLSADDLSIGDNELSVDVIAPDGSVDSETIELHLELRVRADLGPLANAPPAIDVVVEAPPGSEVTLDGRALELDAQGRGTRRDEIDGADANAEGIVDHVVRYRVVPPQGEAAQGELHTHIPLTSMQLDRPGREVVTDAESVEVAGAVSPGTTVTVDGDEVEVRLGRFLTTYALGETGDHTIEVVARASGKAPRVQRVHVRRVEDLEAEAARFEVNRELTYGRLAQNPTTYRGQHVELEGLVYNVVVRDGHSDIQIDVAGCANGQHCPLWASYPAATTVEVQQHVRVLGTVAGEQQFRSQSGDIRTVPRVDATFVLPAERRR